MLSQAEDYLVAQRRRAHLAPHDRMLRKFQYSDALSAALRTGRAEVRKSVLREGGGINVPHKY